MRTITILDDEIRELLLEQKTLILPYTDDVYKTQKGATITVSARPEADPEAELHVTPHEIWDAEVGGSLITFDRAGQKVCIRATYKGFEDPLAISRNELYDRADLLGYG